MHKTHESNQNTLITPSIHAMQQLIHAQFIRLMAKIRLGPNILMSTDSISQHNSAEAANFPEPMGVNQDIN